MPKNTQDENESNEAEKDNEIDQVFSQQRTFTPGSSNVKDLIKHYEQMGQGAPKNQAQSKKVASKKDVEMESNEEQSEEKMQNTSTSSKRNIARNDVEQESNEEHSEEKMQTSSSKDANKDVEKESQEDQQEERKDKRNRM